MPLTEDEVVRLEDRARQVGRQVGWDLRFVVAPNPEFVGVSAGPEQILIIGPLKVENLTALDIEMDLDAMANGSRQIVLDEDGDPRLL